MVQRTLSKRIHGVARLMKDFIWATISVIAVISGTLLFIYGASADVYDNDVIREMSLIAGIGVLGFIWLMIKSD